MAISDPTTNHNEIQAWAARNGAVPTEVLPLIVDGAPQVLRFMLREQTGDHKNVRIISREEFFLKFDELGLTFVYDRGTSDENEILQVESRSPYRSTSYRIQSLDN